MKKILAIGSCLSLLSIFRSGAERYFEPMGMLRFCRIDCLNSYLTHGIEHDDIDAFSELILDDKQKDELRQQYKGMALGASFESTSLVSDNIDEIIKEAQAIVMDTFFDQRAKVIRIKNSGKTPVFLKIPEAAQVDDFDILDPLTAEQIKEEYLKWYCFIQKINPKCKLIVMNFTSLTYLENKEKLTHLKNIDKEMQKICRDNLYYVCHQNFSIEHYDDLNGQRTLCNHLSIPTYQKYITLIDDIIDDRVTANFFDSDTINRYPNMINDLKVKI